jgi:hypothetical protein
MSRIFSEFLEPTKKHYYANNLEMTNFKPERKLLSPTSKISRLSFGIFSAKMCYFIRNFSLNMAKNFGIENGLIKVFNKAEIYSFPG